MAMEKTPLRLKLKIGGPSTPETSEATSLVIMTEDESTNQLMSDDDDDDADDGQEEDDQPDEEPQEGSLKLRISHLDDSNREKHKKSKKKKRKREKEKHKHRHHRDRDDDEGEPPVKRLLTEEGVSDAVASSPAETEMAVPSREAVAAMQVVLEYLLKQLEKKDPQQFFSAPVTDLIAPGYSSIISTPMDFLTMKQKIEASAYSSLSSFLNDFQLICNNCMTYNQPETIYYKAAKKLLHAGEKFMAADKLMLLRREIPQMSLLTSYQLGFDLDPLGALILEEGAEGKVAGGLMPVVATEVEPPMEVEERVVEVKENKFEPIADDLTPEEVLTQVQAAAQEAADELSIKKPDNVMGVIRLQTDGTVTLNILTGCEGANFDPTACKEKPVNLGLLTGKLTQGMATLHNYREDKRNMAKPVKPLYYGAFSSFCPSYDSTFANLTKEESEMVFSTYGNDTAVQYAESICDFSHDCDTAMHLVNQLLNLLTHQQHSRTMAVVEERRSHQQEEEHVAAMLMAAPTVESNCGDVPEVNFSALRTLSELGIDTGFLEPLEQTYRQIKGIDDQLEENVDLLEQLSKEQRDRLSLPLPNGVVTNLPQPTSSEMSLAEKVTSSLTSLAKNAPPSAMVNREMIRRVVNDPGRSKAENGKCEEDLECQLRHILNQDAASSPPMTQGQTGTPLTDSKLEEILG